MTTTRENYMKKIIRSCMSEEQLDTIRQMLINNPEKDNSYLLAFCNSKSYNLMLNKAIRKKRKEIFQITGKVEMRKSLEDYFTGLKSDSDRELSKEVDQAILDRDTIELRAQLDRIAAQNKKHRRTRLKRLKVSVRKWYIRNYTQIWWCLILVGLTAFWLYFIKQII